MPLVFPWRPAFSRKLLWKHWKLFLTFAERIVSLNVWYRLVPMPQWLRYRKCLLLHARPAGRTQYDDHYNLMQFFKCEYWISFGARASFFLSSQKLFPSRWISKTHWTSAAPGSWQWSNRRLKTTLFEKCSPQNSLGHRTLFGLEDINI